MHKVNDLDAYKRENHYDTYSMDLSKIYYIKITEEVKRLFTMPAKMLDVACYDGTLGESFLKTGWSVYGIEAHRKACEEARRKGLDVTQKDIEEGLPYPDSSFDLVIAAEIIEHLYDTDKFLEEIRRILKPSGFLILTIPNIACLANRVGLFFGRYPRFAEYQAGRSGGHIRVYTKKAVLDQIRQHGFQILKCRGANLPCPMNVKLIPLFIKKIAVWLGNFTPSVSGQIIITAANTK